MRSTSDGDSELALVSVLRSLVNGSIDLSDSLRQALLIPLVNQDESFQEWATGELVGYASENVSLPTYRQCALSSFGNAMNRAYRVTTHKSRLPDFPNR